MIQSPVRLVRYNNLLFVSSADEALRRELCFYERVFPSGAALRAHIVAQRQEGVENPKNFQLIYKRVFVEHAGGIITPSGMTNRVCTYLRNKWIPFEFEDTRPVLLPDPDYSRLIPLRGDQPDILGAMIANDHGLIDYPTGSGKSVMIVAYCLLYPTVPILIVTPNRGTVRTLVRYFADRGVQCGVHADGQRTVGRITVTTPNSLPSLQRLMGEVRVFIFDEVYKAAAKGTADLLAHVSCARMFGLADKPLGRSDGRNKVIESFFGPIIASATYAESVDAGMVTPIEVLCVPVGAHPVSGKVAGASLNTQKRNCYWLNEVRNNRIVEAVSIGAAEIGQSPETCQTLILCEKTMHALELKKLLPHFTVCHGGLDAKRKKVFLEAGYDPASVNLKDAQLKVYQRQFETGELRHAIATTVWAIGVNFEQLPLLVRADGITSTTANTQIPGRLSRLFEGKKIGLLVDLLDNFHTWAEERSNRRLDFYRSRKWPVRMYQPGPPLHRPLPK